jgi:hypothetical protein
MLREHPRAVEDGRVSNPTAGKATARPPFDQTVDDLLLRAGCHRAPRRQAAPDLGWVDRALESKFAIAVDLDCYLFQHECGQPPAAEHEYLDAGRHLLRPELKLCMQLAAREVVRLPDEADLLRQPGHPMAVDDDVYTALASMSNGLRPAAQTRSGSVQVTR